MSGRASLAVFKALGDNTRYAIYLELARAAQPLSTSEIAAELNLHVNTVRPHLERMRDIGLLELSVDVSGVVGRPQHRYALAPDAPSLGLEPPAFPMAARVLLRAASNAGLSADDLIDAGHEQGAADREQRLQRSGDRANGDGVANTDDDEDALGLFVEHLADLGFDPAVFEGPACTTVAFGHCPFQDLAEADPDLVCGMHRGLVEGFLARGERPVAAFRSLTEPNSCQVDLAVASAADD